ncbi:hypothetical protein QU698_24850, partial [Enterobacter hormaechei subsp. xiangfangensis]|uniref:hypothetical protein n=2 Tax=Enterobacteriaceae TaxID=543 RepID=UPI0028749016
HKTIFEQIGSQALRHKGWKRISILELSLKYKYKDFAPFRVEKPTPKSSIQALKHSSIRTLKN